MLDKPAGMTVVAGRGVPRPTLLDLAIERWPDARPVHRLDKPTTGCTVVAKTALGQVALSDAFRRHIVDKRYLAFIVGVPAWDSLAIDARLARVDDPDLPGAVQKALHGKKTLSIQTIDEESGVRALTRVRVLGRGNGVTLVEARPETGRMHQIRAHLAHVGFPLVGDALYGASGAFERFIDGQDVALHAFCISFPKPDGGRAFVTSKPPTSWSRFASDRNISLAGVEEARLRFLKPVLQPAQKPTQTTQTTHTTTPSKTPHAKAPHAKTAKTTHHKPPAKHAPRPGSKPPPSRGSRRR